MIDISSTLQQIREKSPLVHNITNYVVMNNTANALLAVGASPVMAHAIEEVEDILNISSSLVINMGTLSEKWVESMLLALEKANSSQKPSVFDPVGVGASAYRNEVAAKILQAGPPAVIRGNASEIMALAQFSATTKGVDSTLKANEAREAGIHLSKTLNNTIVISGETDLVITGDQVTQIQNGSSLMAKVTGMGCTATSIIGACLGVEKDAHKAAVSGMAIMGVVGDITALTASAPGTFQVKFIDNLYLISPEELKRSANVS